mmetsp:Transcript_3268/g.7591  ORF Transcript_3268/g.7591 Transcript_3268/m.7591 type:complete len:142 (+) Transcript_3268:236-661(+)
MHPAKFQRAARLEKEASASEEPSEVSMHPKEKTWNGGAWKADATAFNSSPKAIKEILCFHFGKRGHQKESHPERAEAGGHVTEMHFGTMNHVIDLSNQSGSMSRRCLLFGLLIVISARTLSLNLTQRGPSKKCLLQTCSFR